MSDGLLELRELIDERAGVFVREHIAVGFLERFVQTRMEATGCASITDYNQILSRSDEASEAELLHLITAFSRPATGFYRQTEAVRVLIDVVLPQCWAGRPKKELTIWSAGCSTGEEPLAIAMALDQAGWFERLHIGIEACDGNIDSIATARSGVFKERRLRSLAPALRDKYFVPTEDRWQVVPELHQRIRWALANLCNEKAVAHYATADIIFCQKVLIYFSDAKAEKVLRSFTGQMPPGGYLFADQGDHFERLVSRTGGFERHEIDGFVYWEKRDTNS